jgi:hypothetical protein
MILTAPLYVTPFANPQSVTHLALNLKMHFAMSNAKNLFAKLNAQIKDVKCLTAQNVLQFASNLIALLIVKLLNQNAKQFVKNPNATGNVTNLNAPNLNVN